MIKKCMYVFDRKHKWKLLILCLMILAGSILELLGVSAVLPLVNIVLLPGQTTEVVSYLKFLPFAKLSDAKYAVIYCIISLIVVYILKNIFLCLMYYCQYSFVFQGQRELSCKLMKCYIRQNYLFHVMHNVADLQRNVMEDTKYFFMVIQASLELLTEVAVCLILIVYLLHLDFAITFVVMFLVSIYLLFYFLLIRKKITRLGEKNRKTFSLLNKFLLQSFGGIKEIKVFRKEDYFLDNYNDAYLSYASFQTAQQFMGILPRPVMETILIAGLMGTITFEVYKGEDYLKFIPLLSVFVVAAVRMLPSFSRVAGCINTISFYKSSVDALYDDLAVADVINKTNPYRKAINRKSDGEYSRFIGDIKLQDISFRYPGNSKFILQNVSFNIKNMSSIAFVGESGAGKTTLADVILGVLQPESGTIMVNERNVYGHLDEWLSEIGYIPQTVYLTDDTIAANIAFGIPEDKIDRKKLLTAINRSQLRRFIDGLPDKEFTIVGERGVRLSGGQRQRIGIARALYNDPSILILDEATSALDSETEKAIMESIDSLQGDITIIIIAHRLSTIKNCNVIYEVKDAKVMERDKETYLRIHSS